MIYLLAIGLMLCGMVLQYLLRYLALRRVTGDRHLDAVWRYPGEIVENRRERLLRATGIGFLGTFGGLGLIAESTHRGVSGALVPAGLIACCCSAATYLVIAYRAGRSPSRLESIYETVPLDD